MAVATQTAPQPSSVWKRIRYGPLYIELTVGFLYVALNFPHMLGRLAHPAEAEAAIFAPLVDWIQPIVATTQARAGSHALFQMPNIMALLFIEVAIYLGLGVLIAIRTTLSPITIYAAGQTRDWRPHLVIGPMLGGLLAGFVGLHAAAWLAIVTILVMLWIYYVIGIIGAFFGSIIAFVVRLLFGLLVGIWNLLGWWLLVPVMIVLGILFFRRQLNLHLLMILALSALGLSALFVVVPPILRFLGYVLQVIADFLARYVLPLLRIIVELILWIVILLIKVAAGIWLIAQLGRLLIDQFRASATVCDGPRGMFLGGFGIGSILTLIFLGTVFQPNLALMLDQGWTLAWQWLAGWAGGVEGPAVAYVSIAALYRSVMPEWLFTFGSTWLSNRSVPLFDMMAALVILAMSCLVLCVQIFKHDVEVDDQLVSFFGSQLLKNFGLYFIAVLLVFLQGYDDNS